MVFRVRRLRGELFGLLTLAVTFVLATIVLNTPIDGGPGVYLSGVPSPASWVADRDRSTCWVSPWPRLTVATAYGSRVASVSASSPSTTTRTWRGQGRPTFRYKLRAFALSAGIAGRGRRHARRYVSYVTVGETFSITVPLYVVLMSILGGARHWLGPRWARSIITASLYVFTGGQTAVLGRAVVALALILVILLLPEGVVPAALRRWRRPGRAAASPPPPHRRRQAAAAVNATRVTRPARPRRLAGSWTSGQRFAASRRCGG